MALSLFAVLAVSIFTEIGSAKVRSVAIDKTDCPTWPATKVQLERDPMRLIGPAIHYHVDFPVLFLSSGTILQTCPNGRFGLSANGARNPLQCAGVGVVPQ
jgi:hypothetical protein